MGLPALEFLERRQIRVFVVESDDEAERDLVVVLVIEKSAAPGVFEWPALGVDHSPRLMFLGRNVPQLLDAKAEMLRSAFIAKAEQPGDFLGQVTARAFREERVAGMEFDSRLVIGTSGAVARHAHVSGRDPFDASRRR